MSKNKKIEVKGTEITIYQGELNDYISLTDIARHKDAVHTDTIIQNWLRNRNTIELLGFWEQIYNPNFKPLEFEGFRKQAGLNSFVLTPQTLDRKYQCHWYCLKIWPIWRHFCP